MCQVVDHKWIKECPFESILVSWRKGRGERRYIIGQISLSQELGATFAYDANLERAKSKGFIGYPGLPINKEINQTTALDLFLRRVINTERGDASKKLDFWKVKSSLYYNKLYILGMTQGRSSSDEFEFLPVLRQMPEEYTFVTDIAGLGHCKTDIQSLKIGQELTLVPEPSNIYDFYAVEVQISNNQKLGYIKQGINRLFFNLGELPARIIHIIDTDRLKQVFISCTVPKQ